VTPEDYAKVHQKAFRCAFDFLNQHFPPGDTEEWWKQTAQDCSAASLAFGEAPIVIELLNGIMNYLGKEYHRRNEHGTAND
jgi:hypothetical protein